MKQETKETLIVLGAIMLFLLIIFLMILFAIKESKVMGDIYNEKYSIMKPIALEICEERELFYSEHTLFSVICIEDVRLRDGERFYFTEEELSLIENYEEDVKEVKAE